MAFYSLAFHASTNRLPEALPEKLPAHAAARVHACHAGPALLAALHLGAAPLPPGASSPHSAALAGAALAVSGLYCGLLHADERLRSGYAYGFLDGLPKAQRRGLFAGGAAALVGVALACEWALARGGTAAV